MAIEDYYKTVEKGENTKTPNGRGGFVLSWAITGDFQGLINQATSKEIDIANKKGIEADFKLYCPVDTVVDNDDFLKWIDGEYYRVVSKPKNTVQRDHHWKILLKHYSIDQETFSI